MWRNLALKRALQHFLLIASVAGALYIPSSTQAAESASPGSAVYLLGFEVDAALPPIGYSRFCLRYPEDCKVHGIDFRHRNIAVTSKRWDELNIVNRAVNSAILATKTPGNGATEEWVLSPPTGDCKAYAITKRHELLAHGWPSRSLLLSEVLLLSGEHHLVLVVHVKDGDFVLDNLNNEIHSVAATYGNIAGCESNRRKIQSSGQACENRMPCRRSRRVSVALARGRSRRRTPCSA
jgi:predicted transglutaminase-like cysteine proteinase